MNAMNFRFMRKMTSFSSFLSAGSSVMTTPKWAGQTSPGQAIDYSPTYAKGNELADRKEGKYKRDKAGDDDDAY